MAQQIITITLTDLNEVPAGEGVYRPVDIHISLQTEEIEESMSLLAVLELRSALPAIMQVIGNDITSKINGENGVVTSSNGSVH
ncbi:hypothetical protein EG069_15645 [Salmonella enterica]|nr:hypothetical protein [Salmonella enterica]EBR0085659.1 hypothetical protein [Salmonella enterica subsp. enterica serovar Wangata]EDT2941859.1 hypothetical protein [Salmonella enterica subsp. enterica]